ncbi:MAG: efflux RND transporter periplasmic adaptor subunit [Bacteroidaceae bacterium]
MRHKILYTTVLLVSGLVAGCHAGHDAHHQDGDSHEEKVTLTSYNQDYEIYCESNPLIAGQQARMLVHVTRLIDFKPLPQARLSLSLAVGGKRQPVEADTLQKPGVAVVSLLPKHAGQGLLTIEVNTSGRQPCRTEIPIVVYADHNQAHEALEEQSSVSGNLVPFTKEMAWKSHFRTEECRMTPFSSSIRVMAQVETAQGEECDVVARAAGVVRMGANPPIEGMNVGKGQTLLVVDGTTTAEGNLDVRLQEAEAVYSRAQAELERKEPLAKDGIVSQSDLQAARADFATAKAQWESLKGLFKSGKQMVTAPQAGYVTQVNVRSGQYVEAGQTLLSLSSNRWLTLRAQLPQNCWPQLPYIHDAHIRVAESDTLVSLASLEGSLLSYGRQVSGGEPLVPVFFRIRNISSFLPGSWVEMHILTRTNSQALTIPTEALIEEMGLYFVYVQHTPELFEKKEVSIGGTDGRRVEVLSGLKAGERVVSKGAVLVKLAHATGTVDPHAGHAH